MTATDGGGPASRPPGTSVRLKLTFSYAGFVVLIGALMIVVARPILVRAPGTPGRRDGLDELRDVVVRNYPQASLLALLVLLAVGLAGGWILAGRMLAPLHRITEATRKAATGSLSHRIALDGPQDEFRELADAFDAMLARLEAHVAEQQRFAANASHELRTPLATTQALLEVARDDPDRDLDELVARLQVVNAQAIELTEALLLLSRADAGSLPRETVDLSLLAEEATETLLPLAERRGVRLDTGGEVTPTLGSHALLLQLTMNLVHNGIVHNLAENGTVQVHTAAVDGAVVLTVENTGEPLAPEVVATLTEPFQRGTRHRRDDQAGAGLGLAIVDRIARAHGGRLTLAARPQGGLRVRAELPAA